MLASRACATASATDAVKASSENMLAGGLRNTLAKDDLQTRGQMSHLVSCF